MVTRQKRTKRTQENDHEKLQTDDAVGNILVTRTL